MFAGQPFALFIDNENGPLFRQHCDDLEDARRIAQELADSEGWPFLVFSFKDTRQVGRFKPRTQKTAYLETGIAMAFAPDPPICQEDVRLLEEFATTTESYFDAVKNLKRVGGEAAIFKAWELAELTRKDCFAAREALERHREEHGCRRLRVRRLGA